MFSASNVLGSFPTAILHSDLVSKGFKVSCFLCINPKFTPFDHTNFILFLYSLHLHKVAPGQACEATTWPKNYPLSFAFRISRH